MNDCGNAEIRDRLPDLLHDQLDAPARAAVMVHLEGCVDCRAELEVLRGIRETFARRVPNVDVQRVVAALSKPGVQGLAAGRNANAIGRRRVWSDWRVAAAVTLFVVGGSSAVVLDRGRGLDAVRAADTAQLPTTHGVADEDDNAPMPGTGRRLQNLNEQQLKALLDDIGQMQPVPLADPEPVTLRVDGRGSAVPEEP